MEQDRVDFFISNVWDYANLASARLLVQDEVIKVVMGQHVYIQTCLYSHTKPCIHHPHSGVKVSASSWRNAICKMTSLFMWSIMAQEPKYHVSVMECIFKRRECINVNNNNSNLGLCGLFCRKDRQQAATSSTTHNEQHNYR